MINHFIKLCFFSPQNEDAKPFQPEQAREIVMSLEKPAVYCNMTSDWPALHWNVAYLAELLAGKRMLFRMGVKDVETGTKSFSESTIFSIHLSVLIFFSSFQPQDHS